MAVRGALYNNLDEAKIRYILEMRKALCDKDICDSNDGSLNLKYCNVKKGHYWSHERTEELIAGVLKHGVMNFKQIKKEFSQNWTETEIKLRTCKLLRYYNLDDYKNKKFETREEILDEAKKNRKHAMKLDEERKSGKQNIDGRLVGGIFFNPKPMKEQTAELEKMIGVNQYTSNFVKKTEEKKQSDQQ